MSSYHRFRFQLTVGRAGKGTITDTNKSQVEDLLRKLPGELRNTIWDLVLVEESGIGVHFRKSSAKLTDHPRWKEPGLLKASKWIRQEAKAIYYQRNTFEVSLSTDEFGHVYEWIRCVMEGCEEHVFPLCKLYVTKSSWAGVHSWLFLAKLAYGLEVILDVHRIEFEDPKDWMYAPQWNAVYDGIEGPGPWGCMHPSPTRTALVEVIALGRRAIEEEWHESMLEIEFEEWVEATMNSRLIRKQTAKDRVAAGFGKLQRRMIEAEGGRSEESELSDVYRGRTSKAVGRTQMRLRSQDA